ncbi:SRPBCC family protein [Actinoplanes sp. NPDC051346]|uniref:SRPBCC family protein n=1 Tax=Actinoplanes sp. NPDC051346 TaxID=3155048 RepID=UPI00341AC326
MALIELTTLVKGPAEQVFDICLDVDAHTASMSRSRERVVGGVTSGRMALGDTVTWAARHFGVPWRLTSRISAYDRPHRFVDEQVTGPFQHWHHEHTFTSDKPAQATIMRDVIDFAAPLGPLGRIVDRLLLERYMRRLIENRNTHLARLFAAESGQGR